MYSYISEDKLKGLVLENRVAVVVENVSTKDIDEYITNCFITLRSYGFNTTKLNQPKIFNDRAFGQRNLILTVRNDAKDEDINMRALEQWACVMGNVVTLQQYIKDKLL